MVSKNVPFLSIGPGEFIKEELEARSWRQEDLADILGMSLKSVNKLIKNKQAITIETAKLLSKAFGQSPHYWINLDTNYRLRLQKETQRDKDVEIKAEIYRHMPINEILKKGWIDKVKDFKSLTDGIKKFLGIEELNFSFMDKIILPNFRKSEAFAQYNKYFALTWFQMAKNCARVFEVNTYNDLALNILVTNSHRYMTLGDGVERLLKDLNEAGIKFFVLSHLQKTYIDGASFFDNTNPVIVYTARYNRIDNFWFTLAHEIGHILLHLKKPGDFFIDNLDVLYTENEKAANKFAEKMLKTKEIFKYFMQYKKYISRDRVLDCADKLNINPAVVVGILQHHDILSIRNLNDFKTPVLELIPEKFLAEKYFHNKKQRVA